MQFSSGSVVFSVQNVLFRIPKALLQQHSEAFSSMLDMSNDGKEERIVLQDSLEAFRDFRSALFTCV
ncbi:hypothetical protein DL93DRAFT_2080813 [Clavulina sp. PMI_390]|nr:hypothetical protein DL93DRAFT_2080813 [Clavulina sp. PMI_390]